MHYKAIIDISWPISEAITAYKDRKVVSIIQTKQFEQDGVREAVVTLGTHTGTHVDAPAHFLAAGKTIDQLALPHVVGACRVLDMTDCIDELTVADFERYNIQPGERLLCKTKNSILAANAPFNQHFVYLGAAASEYLAAKGVLAVGVDYLGIERQQPGHDTHKALFNADITIIEGLRLVDVLPGNYFLICLPLLMDSLDAAPARAILLQQ
jgi:arylformamidase